MKLMVSGIGGVGGYIAAVLCRYYPGSVTLIARGERKKALEQRGLVVHSAVLGEQTYHPAVTDCPADVGIQDVIFVCVKTFSLNEALAALHPCIDEHTVVVPVMNGIDHADRTRAALPAGRVVNSLIYITSSYDGEYAIRHASPYARMRADSPDRDAAALVCRLLHHEQAMECTIPQDMKSEVWKKYIINCAYNTITAYYTCTTRGLLEHPERLAEFRALLDEAYAVAIADGVQLPSGLTAEIFEDMMHYRNADATSSMARDAMAHKPTELETFSGHLVRLADRLGVPAPVSKRFYQELLKREVGK